MSLESSGRSLGTYGGHKGAQRAQGGHLKDLGRHLGSLIGPLRV